MIQYYFVKDGKQLGPFSMEELADFDINENTLIWYVGLDNWKTAAEIKHLKIRNKSNRLSIYFLMWVFFLLFVYYFFNNYSNQESEIDEGLYEEIKSSSYSTDVDFNFYVDKFYRDARVMGLYPVAPKTISIKFADLNKLEKTTHIHALCFGVNDDERIEIYVNPITWERFNKPMRYVLMYHELAHDVFNIPDLESSSPIAIKKLMNPSLSDFRSFTMDEFIESYQSLFLEILADS
jgi:hypothetical protein